MLKYFCHLESLMKSFSIQETQGQTEGSYSHVQWPMAALLGNSKDSDQTAWVPEQCFIVFPKFKVQIQKSIITLLLAREKK